MVYERDVLFPLAGLSADKAKDYYEVMDLVDQLSYAGNEAARRYLDGQIDATAAAAWLEKYAMMPRARAEQRVKFFDQYRSYVINYNLGKDLVRAFIERRTKGDALAAAAVDRVRRAAVVAAPARQALRRHRAQRHREDIDRAAGVGDHSYVRLAARRPHRSQHEIAALCALWPYSCARLRSRVGA